MFSDKYFLFFAGGVQAVGVRHVPSSGARRGLCREPEALSLHVPPRGAEMSLLPSQRQGTIRGRTGIQVHR